MLQINDKTVFDALETAGLPKIMSIAEYFRIALKEKTLASQNFTRKGMSYEKATNQVVKRMMKTQGWTREQTIDWLKR